MEGIKLSQSNMAYISRVTEQKPASAQQNPALVEQPPVKKKKNGKKLIIAGLIAAGAVGAAAILISKKGGIKKVFDGIKSKKNINKGAQDLAQDITDAAKKATQGTADVVDKATDTVGEAIGKTNDAVGEALSEAASKAVSKQADEVISDTAVEIATKVSDEIVQNIPQEQEAINVAAQVAETAVSSAVAESAVAKQIEKSGVAAVVEDIQQKPKEVTRAWPPKGNGVEFPNGKKVTYKRDKDDYFIESIIINPDGSKEVKTFEPSLRRAVPRHGYVYDASGKPLLEKDIMMGDNNKISSWSVYKIDDNGKRYDRVQKRFHYDDDTEEFLGYEKRHELQKDVLIQIEEFDAKGKKIREYLEDKRRR